MPGEEAGDGNGQWGGDMTRDDIIRMAREAGGHELMRIDGAQDSVIGITGNNAIICFAALVAAAEREAIADEWWACYQADMENGVKCLNERAADKFLMLYPAISEFGNWLNEREQT